jgi:hypothetical protein
MVLPKLGLDNKISASFCKSSLSFGWTDTKPPAIFATLSVRWLCFRSKQNFSVLLSGSAGQTEY